MPMIWFPILFGIIVLVLFEMPSRGDSARQDLIQTCTLVRLLGEQDREKLVDLIEFERQGGKGVASAEVAIEIEKLCLEALAVRLKSYLD